MKYDEVIKNLDANKIKEIISQYVKHKPLINQNNYNIFSIINLRENNHTELLAWFLDKNHTFLKKFLTNEYLNINKLGIDINNDDYMNKLVGGMKVEIQYPIAFYDEKTLRKGDIDIFMYNDDCEFLCVIESKLDANICLDKDGTTQIEKYYKYMQNNDKFNQYKKCYVFLCRDTETLKTEKVSKVAKRLNTIPVINGKRVLNETIADLFGLFTYQMIEHSDIILMLYDVLKNYEDTCINCFYTEIIRQYIEYWEKDSKFIDGYSDIVEVIIDNKKQYIYMWDVCEKLKKEFPEKYKLLSKEEKEIVDSIYNL